VTAAPRLYPRRVRWHGWERRGDAGLHAARLAARLHSPARMWLRSCLLALVVAFGATACDRLDCFDGAQLESAYRTGEAQAAAENQAAFERGRTDGLAATRADGEREGWQAGYDDGYADGYEEMYDDGYDRGWVDGGNGAVDAGCSAGAADGDGDGYDAGYGDGHDAGYEDAYGDGWNTGWNDGAATCPAARKRPDPEDVRACQVRGHDAVIDPWAYARGLDEGKRLNPEYQAGFQEAYPRGWSAGAPVGRDAGWDAGYADGHAAGWEAGFEAGYVSCYDQVYAAAYADGWDSGYTAGWDTGWYAGYDSGYAEGARCQ
jgi:flagellar biosynthesis/type III secretory pathway protein FliH